MYLAIIMFLAAANLVLVALLWHEFPRMIRRELKRYFEEE